MALENHFTTSEQSKRLLELGVPLTSADCVRNPSTGMVFFIQEGRVTEGYLSLYKASRGQVAEAAWSVGRLQKIFKVCHTEGPITLHSDDDIFLPENLVEGIELRIKEFDFSRWEE